MSLDLSFCKRIIKKIAYTLLSSFLKTTGPDESIYLTFDDGPHLTNTRKILETLKVHNAHATFFFVGKSIEKHPTLVTELLMGGHQIGYHSYNHDSTKKVSLSALAQDLAVGKNILRQFGVKEFLYRPPYGELTFLSLMLLIMYGWKIVMWSVEGRDSFDTEEEVLENLNVQNITNGSIILLHDVYDKTATVLPELLERYNRAGFRLKKLSYKTPSKCR